MPSIASRRPRLSFPPRPSTLAAWIIAAATIGAAVAFSILVGFIGAPGQEEFDWALSAEVGTALGTLLLAGYTAWLATTTRQEVGVAIEEQRSRDRPIIVVTPTEIGLSPLDQTIGKTVPVLRVRVRNIGLGPALELVVQATPRLPVSSADEPTVWTEEIRAVWKVDQDEDLDLSLARFEEPLDGFRADGFHLEGTYTDRRQAEGYEIELLVDAGLRDDQLEAQRVALARASVWIISGSRTEGDEDHVGYEANIGNLGHGDARDVELQFFRAEDQQPFGDLLQVGLISANMSILFPVSFPVDHPGLSCDLRWRDGSGESRVVRTERVYPREPVMPGLADQGGGEDDRSDG